jgi:hypothetical protein
MSLDGYTSVDRHLGCFLTMVNGVHACGNLKQLTGSGGWEKGQWGVTAIGYRVSYGGN